MSAKTGGMLSGAARSSPASDADVAAHWRTPPKLAEAIRLAWGLDPWAVDLAATRESSLAPEYFGPDHEDPARRDGLMQPWSGWAGQPGKPSCTGESGLSGPIWCNPPYSRQGIDRWMQTCSILRRPDRPVVALVFARTDCVWFHDGALIYAEEALMIRGRVAFLHPSGGKPRAPAGAPSMAILWRHTRSKESPLPVRGLSWR